MICTANSYAQSCFCICRFSLRLDDSHTVEMVPELILRAKYDIKLYLDPLNEN